MMEHSDSHQQPSINNTYTIRTVELIRVHLVNVSSTVTAATVKVHVILQTSFTVRREEQRSTGKN
jgi:hypothetical protein